VGLPVWLPIIGTTAPDNRAVVCYLFLLSCHACTLPWLCLVHKKGSASGCGCSGVHTGQYPLTLQTVQSFSPDIPAGVQVCPKKRQSVAVKEIGECFVAGVGWLFWWGCTSSPQRSCMCVTFLDVSVLTCVNSRWEHITDFDKGSAVLTFKALSSFTRQSQLLSPALS